MKIFLLVCCIVMVGFSVSLGATIESITVYEQTGYVVAMTYLINHPRLGIGMENDAYFDFFGGGGWSLGPNPPPIDGEIYDSYISNSDGTQNMNGMYLTINCFRGLYGVGDGVANNIDAVSLDYSDGTKIWANVIINYTLGLNQPLELAYLERALGSPDGNSTRVGDQHSG